MKKQTLTIFLLVFIFSTISASSFFLININNRRSETFDIKDISFTKANYNNYVSDNMFDCRNNRAAWQSNVFFNSKLTISDGEGNNLVIRGKTESFQLLDNKFVFLKKGDLFYCLYSNEKKQLIAKDISKFVATEKRVYYISNNTLFEFNFDNQKSNKLKSKIDFIYYHKDKLFVIAQNGQLFSFNSEGKWQTLCKLEIDFLPMNFMPQNDFIISEVGNEFKYTNIYTGVTETISIVKDNYENNKICYICDDNLLYVSFQSTKTNGSFVKDVDSEMNGLWCYDYQNKKTKKISNDVFEQLYLFEDNNLFGVKNNKLYRVEDI